MKEHFREFDKYFVMEDGETILRYDAVAKFQDYYNPDMYEYIGKGVICWINGMPQNYSLDNPDHIEYFFKRIY